MGNLTEGLQSSRVFNHSEPKYDDSQGYSRYSVISKISKKDLGIFHQNITGLNSNKLDQISITLQILHILYA
jgi:hypothetical protein